jgi:hypothetical protein
LAEGKWIAAAIASSSAAAIEFINSYLRRRQAANVYKEEGDGLPIA